MKKGNILVEQVLADGTICKDYDASLSAKEIYEKLESNFPNISRDVHNSKIILGEYKGQKYAIRCKNITYLGNPHPIYKKRIQIPDDLQEFYDRANELNAKALLIGIYNYEDNLIFVEFGIDTYINKKAHNSSAHVYTSDISAASEYEFFQKLDYFGNRITVFKANMVVSFLEDIFRNEIPIEYYLPEEEHHELRLSDVQSNVVATIEPKTLSSISEDRALVYSQILQERIIPAFETFFSQENKKWYGIECYKKMIEDNYRNKFQPEWAGFFLEYEFEKFINENKLEQVVTYAQDKKQGGIDLDLFFPQLNSYGDLKAHSENSRGIQGNDWETVFGIINKELGNGHIYYIVCEHSTTKDSECNYEVTKFWNAAQNKDNLMSYHTRMKHDVTLKKMYILDINYLNSKFLSVFKQGINSNGKPRSPKIMIEQDNLNHFIIDEMTF